MTADEFLLLVQKPLSSVDLSSERLSSMPLCLFSANKPVSLVLPITQESRCILKTLTHPLTFTKTIYILFNSEEMAF